MTNEGPPAIGPPEEEVLPLRVGMSIAEAEKLLIEATLRHSRWNVKAAAQMLGIDRSTVYEKIKVYGIVREPEKGAGPRGHATSNG